MEKKANHKVWSFYEMACYFYRRKSSYDEYEKNGLNKLLERLYQTAVMSGKINAFKPLPFFNASYSIAMAMANFSDIALMNIHHAISLIIKNNIYVKYPSMFPLEEENDSPKDNEAEEMLCKWMAYCILHFQDNKGREMKDYVDEFRSSLERVYDHGSEEQKRKLAFTLNFSKMIDEHRACYHTDLYPCANNVDNPFVYDNMTRYVDEEGFCLTLTYYPTKDEQHAFLNHLWIFLKNRGAVYQLPDSKMSYMVKMLFNVKEYQHYSRRIDQGEFLVSREPVNTISCTLPDLPASASESDKEFRQKCQQTLNLYSSKIEALEAQLANERKKNELRDLTSIAGVKTQEFNYILEKTYRELKVKYEELNNWKEESELRARDKQSSDSASSINMMLDYCIDYACNDKDVNDSQAENIKQLLEDLLFSPLSNLFDNQEKEKWRRQVHDIRKRRQKMKLERQKTLPENAVTTNNFYGSVGQMIGSNGRVDYTK